MEHEWRNVDERVDAGYDLLVKKIGDPRPMVRLEQLNMANPHFTGSSCGCVLAQVDWYMREQDEPMGGHLGSYSWFLRHHLDIDHDDAIALGFETSGAEHYRELTDAWKRKLSVAT